MKAAKLFLTGLLQVTLLFAFVACESDPDVEPPFINPIPPPEGGEENPNWDWADAYPGPVSTLIPFEADAVAKVRGGYSRIVYAKDTPILQSTGLWARSSEIISIEVPEGVEGLWCQIGIGQPLFDIKIQTAQRRYRDVTTKKKLEPGKVTTLLSNFGGFVYLYYEPDHMPESSDFKEVIINGAVAAPSYTYGETDMFEYLGKMHERSLFLTTSTTSDDDLAFVPWTELISDKVILTLGVKEMSLVTNPEQLLDVYANLHDAYLEFAGYDLNDSEIVNQPPMRIVSDIQLPNPAHKILDEHFNNDLRKYGGYPMVSFRHTNMRDANAWQDEKGLVNSEGQLEFESVAAFTHINDSFGKTVFGSEEDKYRNWAYVVNLHYPLLRVASLYYALTKLEGSQLTDYRRTRYDQIISSNIFITPLDKFRYAVGDWVFARENGYSDVQWGSNPYGHIQFDYKLSGNRDNWQIHQGMTTMFVQLAERYGWGIIKYLFQRGRELNYENEIAQDVHDFIMMACCEYTGQNLTPFFKWYHFPFSQRAGEFAKNFTTLSGAFNDFQNPYFFMRQDFPRYPQIANTPAQPVAPINPWPAKHYYQSLTNRPATAGGDSVNNEGWWVTVNYIQPTDFDENAVFVPTGNEKDKTHDKGEDQRLVDNKFDDKTNWFNLRHTYIPGREITIKTPEVIIHFMNEGENEPMTFNALEVVPGGDGAWISFIYDIEGFIPDDPTSIKEATGGQWIRLTDNPRGPEETMDWYDGVIWTLPLRSQQRGQQAKNAYFFEKTFENVTKLRFKVLPCLQNRYNSFTNPDNGWKMCIAEVSLGMMSPDNPKPPSPGDSDYVPRYTYQGKLETKSGQGGDSWKDYDLFYKTDPAPPSWKGWLHTGEPSYKD